MTTISIRDLYATLKDKRPQPYSMLDLLARLREGIKDPHARNIMSLYWWHLFLNDKDLYTRLKASVDEASMRQILGGKVMTSYAQGEKTIAVCSDIFPPAFFEIIGAYVDYTDELSRG